MADFSSSADAPQSPSSKPWIRFTSFLAKGIPFLVKGTALAVGALITLPVALWCWAGAGIYGSPLGGIKGLSMLVVATFLLTGPFSALPAAVLALWRPKAGAAWLLLGSLCSASIAATFYGWPCHWTLLLVLKVSGLGGPHWLLRVVLLVSVPMFAVGALLLVVQWLVGHEEYYLPRGNSRRNVLRFLLLGGGVIVLASCSYVLYLAVPGDLEKAIIGKWQRGRIGAREYLMMEFRMMEFHADGTVDLYLYGSGHKAANGTWNLERKYSRIWVEIKYDIVRPDGVDRRVETSDSFSIIHRNVLMRSGHPYKRI